MYINSIIAASTLAYVAFALVPPPAQRCNNAVGTCGHQCGPAQVFCGNACAPAERCCGGTILCDPAQTCDTASGIPTCVYPLGPPQCAVEDTVCGELCAITILGQSCCGDQAVCELGQECNIDADGVATCVDPVEPPPPPPPQCADEDTVCGELCAITILGQSCCGDQAVCELGQECNIDADGVATCVDPVEPPPPPPPPPQPARRVCIIGEPFALGFECGKDTCIFESELPACCGWGRKPVLCRDINECVIDAEGNGSCPRATPQWQILLSQGNF